jgi:hypothetical protein
MEIRGCLPEVDGRNFMVLLDVCHYLVDQIGHNHNFRTVEEAALLRSSNPDACTLLTAKMYSFWDSAPAGPGVYEMLVEWTNAQPGAGSASRKARETGQSRGGHNLLGMALHALAINECQYWPRRRKTGAFYFAGEDASGTALLADENLGKIYRVLGISTSLGNLIRAGRRDDEDLTGSSLLLTLLPFMDQIIYDGTVRLGGAPPNREPSFAAQLRSLASAALGDRRAELLVTALPTVVETLLLRKRVVISGLQAKPELNGRFGFAESFSDTSGRYCVELEDGGGSFSLKPANLAEAPPRPEDKVSRPIALSDKELAMQKRLKEMCKADDFWVFRRMGYTEIENPEHMGLIMGGSGMVLGQFRSKKLAPTATEYLTSLEQVLFTKNCRAKPSMLAVDEKTAVEKLQAVLGPAGIEVGYYPPPTQEELTAMGTTS